MLSRDENCPDGLVAAKVVAEVFVRAGLVWELRVGGRAVRTTAEHPFFRDGDGWVAANELRVGDRLRCEDGSCVAVEGVRDTGTWDRVYNVRVADSTPTSSAKRRGASASGRIMPHADQRMCGALSRTYSVVVPDWGMLTFNVWPKRSTQVTCELLARSSTSDWLEWDRFAPSGSSSRSFLSPR